MEGLQPDLDLLEAAALEAGQLAMTFFRRNPGAWAKEGGSPVTEADMAVDTFLRTYLLAARPDYGWLSEETVDDPAGRRRDAVFVVDPIDGTRGFIDGDERWCVSLAIVRQGRPAVAALFAPALGELYTAAAGRGSWAGGQRVAVSPRMELRGSRLAGPRGWMNRPALQRTGAELQSHVPSLAYRFTCVANGRFDGAFASPRSNDWDLAACDLLVHEAGGRLTNLDGTPPTYNRDTLRHGVLAAANEALQPEILAALDAVVLERERAGLSA